MIFYGLLFWINWTIKLSLNKIIIWLKHLKIVNKNQNYLKACILKHKDHKQHHIKVSYSNKRNM